MSRPFLVVCPARTGSTMLITALRSHPDVVVHGEVFGDDAPEFPDLHLADTATNDLSRLRDHDSRTYLDKLVFGQGEHAAVGCKFKFEEMLLVRWHEAVRMILDDTAIHIILLWRDNLLARYLSEFRATQVTHVFNVYDPRLAPTVEPQPFDPDRCEHSFSVAMLRRERFRALFGSHPVHEMTYESILGDGPLTMEHLQDFLGLETHDLIPQTIRLRTEPLRHAITNFEDLRSHFAHTPYESFFDDEA